MKTASPTGGDISELESPYQIFKFLKQYGAVEMFRFMTGNISEHDKMILDKTGASVIDKTNRDEFKRFYQTLQDSKLTIIK